MNEREPYRHASSREVIISAAFELWKLPNARVDSWPLTDSLGGLAVATFVASLSWFVWNI